jgi:UDP-glucose 4-epimerase
VRKALITGGAGFIGSHLASELLARGCGVAVIDDLSTGRASNIQGLKGKAGFSYHLDSIFNVALMRELVDDADVVFHLAAVVGVMKIVSTPVQTIETNIRGSEIVLSLASKKGKKVVLASTSEAYGKSNKPFFNEDDDLILGATSRARWCYAASKIIDEFLGKAYFKEKGTPVVIVRLFNTVGPRQIGRYGMVIPRFVQQALAGEPITVFGDGTQRRSFTWVGDAVQAIIDLSEHPKAVGETFNVGNPSAVSILDLARKVAAMTGSRSEIVFVPYDKAYEEGFEDMAQRCPDISKIRALTGFKPTRSLDEILSEVIAHHRREGGA